MYVTDPTVSLVVTTPMTTTEYTHGDNLNFAGFEHTPMHDTASIFANKGFLGYVVVGILAFLLGISLTLMCDILHKRNKERNEENDRTDR